MIIAWKKKHRTQKCYYVVLIRVEALLSSFCISQFFCLIFCLQVYVLTVYVSREYWMIYRGPGFLAVVWFGSSPTPPPSANCLSLSPPLSLSPHLSKLIVCRRSSDGSGRRGMEEGPNHTTARSLVLCKSFNTLYLWGFVSVSSFYLFIHFSVCLIVYLVIFLFVYLSEMNHNPLLPIPLVISSLSSWLLESVCMCVCLHLSIGSSVCIPSVCLCVCVWWCVCVCTWGSSVLLSPQNISLYLCMSVCLSIMSSVYVFVCLRMYLVFLRSAITSAHLTVCLHVCLSPSVYYVMCLSAFVSGGS